MIRLWQKNGGRTGLIAVNLISHRIFASYFLADATIFVLISTFVRLQLTGNVINLSI